MVIKINTPQNVQQTENQYEEIQLEDVLKERSFNTVLIPEEVVFLYYLDKHLNLEGKTINLASLDYKEEVLDSMYFSLIAREDKGLMARVVKEGRVLKSVRPIENKFYIGALPDIYLEQYGDNDKHWVFRENKSPNGENKILYGGYSSFMYVALLAYIVVEAYKRGVDLEHITIDNLQGTCHSECLSLLPNLIYWGNRIFLRKVTFLYPTAYHTIEDGNKAFRRFAWKSYFIMLREMGYCLEPVSIKEKHKHLMENYYIGMPIFLYRRPTTKKTVAPKEEVSRVHLCIIRAIDERNIKLELIRSIDTKLGKVLTREAAIRDSESDVYKMNYEELMQLNTSEELFDLTSIGVDHLKFEEEYFIMPIHNTDDVKVNLRTTDDPVGKISVEVDTVDYVYTILEEWGVNYDRMKYLVNNYKDGKKPVYEQYREFNVINKIFV